MDMFLFYTLLYCVIGSVCVLGTVVESYLNYEKIEISFSNICIIILCILLWPVFACWSLARIWNKPFIEIQRKKK